MSHPLPGRPASSARPALPRRPGWIRAAAGVVLPGTIVAVSVLSALQIFVLNPLAAAPGGRGLGQVYADLEEAGEGGFPFVFSALILAAGVGVGVTLWFLIRHRERADPLAVLALGLAALVAAVPSYWVASFGMGMALADTYMIGGADRSPWAGPVYALGALAVPALVTAVVVLLRGPAAGLGARRPR